MTLVIYFVSMLACYLVGRWIGFELADFINKRELRKVGK